nr:ribonuclease H-like domain, reverse transcriptase, RNA-dependent DNA polymerase [Tanacetum cinerariifolium]
MAQKDLVHGIPAIKHTAQIYDVCLIGKHSRAPFPKKAKARSTSHLDLVYGDLCGAITPPTPSGKRYIFLLLDDYSRYMWVYFLNTKDQAFDTFKEFKKSIENELRTTLKILRTDQGGEFTSNEFTQYCKKNGIAQQVTAPYSPQQNGVVERRNRTIISMTRSLEDITPYEAIKQKKPNLEKLRIFSCIAYAKVFKTKKDANGDIIKHKARLVAKGYIQQHGIAFEEVFAPVARMETIRLILAIAATNKWEVHHLDVKSVFLHGDLKEEVYVTQPEGFIKEQDNRKVYGLIKALYGLRRAPRAWNIKLDNTLKSLDFKKCALEQAIYTKTSKDSTLLIEVYVDDLIITCAPKKEIDKFKAQMEEKFKMSDLGLLAYYLLIEVTQTNGDILIKQSAYASKILKEAGMLDCNETLIPMDPGTRLTEITEGTVVDNKYAIAPMKNLVFHERSKHIDTKYHFIRECIEREDIQVEFVNGEYQKADILTKALSKIRFLTMRQLIGLKDLRSSVYD